MNIKKWLKGICLSVVMIAGLLMLETSAQAGTVSDSPYVTKSPDGKAFTFNHQDKNWKWYDVGTKVTTGIPSSLRDLKVGEHYYIKKRNGNIPIEKWEVTYETGTCCHNGYPDESKPYHGIDYGKQNCLSSYYSGWNPYCADCHEPISYMLMYMSKEAAQSVTELNVGLDYYYTCPHCNNLEQGSPFGYHDCKGISWNKYKVEYIANTINNGGFMLSSTHMYNNATEYEGEPITPASRLTKNTYIRTGYEFMGWNTKANGSGTFYSDNQEISNLTTENLDDTGKGIITLYAQWKLSESTLHIHPNGGTYQENHKITSVKQEYRTTYVADPKDIVPPDGYEVSFVTGYSKETPSIIQTRTFQEWQLSSEFHGKLNQHTYTYLGKEGMEDTITATYSYDSVTLPNPIGIEETSSSFGGWFYDKECTSPAGKAGDKITPSSNLVLYAKRVDLLLKAVNNMNPYGGSGAVDLSWEQNDGFEKTYLLYQSTDNKAWNRIYGASDLAESKNVNLTFNWENGNHQSTYTIPYTGFYTLTAFGAQGGNYGTHIGGLGGQAEGKLWLTKGEKVTYTLGGQDGSNGGGKGDMFGNGGGCTVITTDQKGTILVAGGGGGGTSQLNGGAGGSSASNISTGITGQSGGAGGGGGNKGGAAGKVITHSHISACKHTHTGSATAGGGCYTIQRVCGFTSFNIREVYTGHYYGNEYQDSSGKWCYDGFCGRCNGNGECVGHDSYDIYYICSQCGKDYGKSNPSSCTVFYGFSIGCGRSEEYVCGLSSGQIISSTQAFGGSNYINTKYFTSHTSHIGTKANNGSFAITSDQIGFEEALYLNEVKATDLAPPKQVVLPKDAKTDLGNNQVKVTWNESRDNGTIYYHKAESYQKHTITQISTSNITRNELISGTKGYYYLVNSNGGTAVNTANGTFTSNTFATVTVTNYAQYLHISAVDMAGNISPTTHIEIGKDDNEIAWGIWTDQVEIASEHESIYLASNIDTYYVRADGATPFQLSFTGVVNVALPTYQVNHTIFKSSTNDVMQEFGLHTKNHPITEDAVASKANDLDKYVTGTSILQDAAYTITTRSEGNKKLAALQKFLLPFEFHGKKIEVTPVVGADYKDGVQYSDVEKDKLNSLWIIGDGIAPVFQNTGLLESLELIDRNVGNVLLEIGVTDDLSGVKEFYIEIYNTDNVSRKRYDADASNVVTVNITEDEPIFSGDFIITLFAKDNVGNTREEVYSTTEFALSSSASRILSPHEPIFKCGESGILNVITYGYADYIEIEFPKAMSDLNPELNRTIHYTETPQYFKEENIQFMVPLATPYNTSFTITVRAYKGDKKLEDYPALSVIEVNETVTDEIRTRLR